jgi:hypothetical protein
MLFFICRLRLKNQVDTSARKSVGQLVSGRQKTGRFVRPVPALAASYSEAIIEISW